MKANKVERATTQLYSYIWSKLDSRSFQEMSIKYNYLAPTGLSEDWFQDKTCLDVGCGSGRFLNTLVGLKARKVCGVDLGALSLRALLVEHSEWTDIAALVQANALTLPFESDSFDLVYCCGVLHTTVDPYHAFRELVRVCKAGGIVVVGVYGEGGLLSYLIKIGRLLAKPIPFKTLDRFLTVFISDPILQGRILDKSICAYPTPLCRRRNCTLVPMLQDE